MAAVIHIRSSHRPDEVSAPEAGMRPALRVLDGGRSAAAVRMRRVYLVRRLVALSVVAVLFAALLSVGAAAFGGGESAAGGASAAALTARTSSGVHVVRSGDTLWSIAASLDPTGDPRDMVRRLVELNASQEGLGATGQLRIGQELRVPAGAR